MSVKLEDVYRMHMNDIYRYLYRLTGDTGAAEDLTQDTFIRAYRFLDMNKDGLSATMAIQSRLSHIY